MNIMVMFEVNVLDLTSFIIIYNEYLLYKKNGQKRK